MKRRFFQIHLLTAVVGMLCTSLLVWMNVVSKERSEIVYAETPGYADAWLWGSKYCYIGCPSTIKSATAQNKELKIMKVDTATIWEKPWRYKSKDDELVVLVGLCNVPELEKQIDWNAFSPEPDWKWTAAIKWRGVLNNAAVAMAITLTLMVGIEWFLRRRERAKI